MQTLFWNTLNDQAREAALSRPEALAQIDVSEILQNVRNNGDKALFEYTQKFDGIALEDLHVPVSEMKRAWDALPEADQAALETAKANIEVFHRAQIPTPIVMQTMSGVECRREPRALDSVGLYVPGGTAPLVSTLMMLALPANIAGVENIVVTTPPQKDGKISEPLLAAAHLCGVKNLFMVGGAQAIAALAYGTESIPKTVKIFGPGNAYVAAAKAQVSMQMGGAAIDLPAGPSEAMVLADDDANPVFVAADMLAQAEHDTLAQVICVCRSEAFAQQLQIEIDAQTQSLPRKDITAEALKHARVFIVETVDEMIEITNRYAPEHLIVQVENADSLMPKINNAGSVFLGPWAPESVGDYASGTNHTLPTFGAARAYSGIVLESFMKFISVQTLTQQGLKNIGPTVERLAQMEGLEAHRRAVSLRLSGGRT